ncbi:MAG: hypothetical protein Kow0020_07150 [Wenzhouxiangellaceae bacterium]
MLMAMLRRIVLHILVLTLCALAAIPARALMSSPIAAWSMLALPLGPWEAYLAHKLTPQVDFVEPVAVPEITWLSIDHDIVLPDFAHSLLRDAGPGRLSAFHLSRSSGRWVTPGAGAVGTRAYAFGLERTTLISGIAAQLDHQSRFHVGAVLASQQFSHSMLDLAEFDGRNRPVDFLPFERELSTGTGVELGVESWLGGNFLVDASFQSRVNMDELASLRGVHGYSADFDLPSRLRMALGWRAGEQTLFTVAVSQVFYSEVAAFPSRALPARFIALLGDSSSPQFKWNDLTVYSVGMRWRNDSDLEFSVDLFSRTRPSPSAPVLASVLDEELDGHSLLVGIGKRFGDRARIDLAASYAPPEFAFGGNVLGVVSEQLDPSVEVAARFNYRF